MFELGLLKRLHTFELCEKKFPELLKYHAKLGHFKSSDLDWKSFLVLKVKD